MVQTLPEGIVDTTTGGARGHDEKQVRGQETMMNCHHPRHVDLGMIMMTCLVIIYFCPNSLMP